MRAEFSGITQDMMGFSSQALASTPVLDRAPDAQYADLTSYRRLQPDFSSASTIFLQNEASQKPLDLSAYEIAMQNSNLDPDKKFLFGREWQIQIDFKSTKEYVGTLRSSGGAVLAIQGEVVGRSLQIVETNTGERYALVSHHVINDPNNKLVWAYPDKGKIGASGKEEKRIIQRLSLDEAQQMQFSAIHEEIHQVNQERFVVKQVFHEDRNKGNSWYEEDLGHVSLGSSGRTTMIRGTVVGREYVTTMSPGGITHEEKKYIAMDPGKPLLQDYAKQKGYDIIDGSTGKEMVIVKDLDDEIVARLEEDRNKSYDFNVGEIEQGREPSVAEEMNKKYPFIGSPYTFLEEGPTSPVMFAYDSDFEKVELHAIPVKEEIVAQAVAKNGQLVKQYTANVIGRTVKFLKEDMVLEVDEYFPWDDKNPDLPKFAQKILGARGWEGFTRKYMPVMDDRYDELPGLVYSGEYRKRPNQKEPSVEPPPPTLPNQGQPVELFSAKAA